MNDANVIIELFKVECSHGRIEMAKRLYDRHLTILLPVLEKTLVSAYNRGQCAFVCKFLTYTHIGECRIKLIKLICASGDTTSLMSIFNALDTRDLKYAIKKAITNNNLDMVHFLVRLACDGNASIEYAFTQAAIRERVDIIAYILDTYYVSASVVNNILAFSIVENNMSAFKCIANFCKLSKKKDINSFLLIACNVNNTDAIKYLTKEYLTEELTTDSANAPAAKKETPPSLIQVKYLDKMAIPPTCRDINKGIYNIFNDSQNDHKMRPLLNIIITFAPGYCGRLQSCDEQKRQGLQVHTEYIFGGDQIQPKLFNTAPHINHNIGYGECIAELEVVPFALIDEKFHPKPKFVG